MQNYNHVVITGFLAADPQLRKISKNSVAARFNLGVNDTWTDDSGNPQQRVNWIPVTFFNGNAQNAIKYLKKGSHVLIEGALRTSTWTDDETKKKRFSMEVIGTRFNFLDRKPEDEQQAF